MKKTIILFLLYFVLKANLNASYRITIDATGNIQDYNRGPYILPLTIIFKSPNSRVIFLSTNNDTLYAINNNWATTIYEDSILNGNKINCPFYIKINDNKSQTITIRAYKHTYQPGLIYYDALKLNEINANPTIDSLQSLGWAILKYYKLITIDSLINNMFLSDLSFSHNYLTNDNSKATESMNIIKSGSLRTTTNSAIGGLDVTNFADGMAKFLVKRAKEELSLAFFENFKSDLNDKKYSDLKFLFPETWKTLMTIDKDIYQYSNYLNTLRQVFIKDMTNQYVNLQNLLNQQKYKDYFSNEHPELGSILYSSLYLINGISSGKHPGDVLANYNVNDIKLCNNKVSGNCAKDTLESNIRNSIATIKLLSASLRSKSSDNYWLSADSVRMLAGNLTTFKIYLGLVYQKADTISFNKKTIYLRHILNQVALNIDSIYKYATFIQAFADNIQEVNEYLTAFKGKKKSEIDYNDYYKLFNASLDLLDQTSAFIDLPYVKLGSTIENQIKSVTSKVIFVARSVGNLYIDVRTKNYSSAIVNVVGVLDTLLNYNFTLNIDSLSKLYDQQINAVNRKKYQQNKDLKNYSNRVRQIYTKLDGLRKQIVKLHIDSANKDSCIRLFLNYTDTLKQTYAKLDRLNKQITSFNKDSYNKRRLKKQIRKYVRDVKQPNAKTDTEFVRKNYMDNDTNQIYSLLITRRNILTAKQKGKLRKYILKYGSFISSVAQAENSDDMEAAIESITLPAGSASIKKNSCFNVSLNAYLGGFWGYEKIRGIDYDKQEITFKGWNSYGVAAPIGISLSWGHRPFNKYKMSSSLFVSIIDIGALAAFRTNNDSVSSVPKVELKDIVSPGIFYSIGIPKWPMSINLGWQMGPLLREVSPDINKFGSKYTRFSISLCVDIPLLNFYTKPK